MAEPGRAFCLQWTPRADADDGRRVLVIRGVCVEGQNLWWREEQQISAWVLQGCGRGHAETLSDCQ